MDWRRFFRPKVMPTFPCGFCGQRMPSLMSKHQIGTAYVKDRTLAKYCDGSEE